MGEGSGGRSSAMAVAIALFAIPVLACGWPEEAGSDPGGWGLGAVAARRGDPVYRGRPLREWLEALASEDAAERLEAAQVATLFEAEDAGAAVPPLLDLLGDPDVALRRLAAEALARLLGPADADAVPVLLRALDDRDPYVRTRAARALDAVGARDASVREALAARLADPAPEVQREVIDALLATGEPASVLPPLAEALDAEDEAVRQWAASRFAVAGEAAVPVLEAYVDRQDAANPLVALAALSAIGRPAAPALARALRAESPQVAQAAREGLVGLGSDAEAALPQLREILLTPPPASAEDAPRRDPRLAHPGAGMGMNLQMGGLARRPESPRDRALSVLRSLGDPAAPILVEAFVASSGDRHFASRVASALDSLGPEALAPHGPVFLKLSREGPRENRARALRLAAAAAEADPALARSFEAELRRGLGSGDFVSRRLALEALERRRSAGAEAIPLVAERLAAERRDERALAARTLKAICPGRSECVAPLAEALDDEDQRVRRAVVGALGGVGPAAADAVPALIERLEAEPRDRAVIAQTLGEIGPAAGSALPQLSALARDADASGQRQAIGALPRIGRPDEACAVLLELAIAAESSRRDDPLQALAALGPRAEPALPELGRLLARTEGRYPRQRILDVYLAVGPAAAPHLRQLVGGAGESAPRDLRVALAKLESETAALE